MNIVYLQFFFQEVKANIKNEVKQEVDESDSKVSENIHRVHFLPSLLYIGYEHIVCMFRLHIVDSVIS